ncbi:MAG: hypothetical protein CMM60_11545 [Rhodospirillaceae bacterium]|nr:hypothetical protein [Rhodospirillaceae bacterium]
MRQHLTILLAEGSATESAFAVVFEEWLEADLLEAVALVDLSEAESGLSAPAVWAREGGRFSSTLRDVVTGAMWEQVTVVAVRSNNLSSYSTTRFDSEDEILKTVEAAFPTLDGLRAYTVGITEPNETFGPDHFRPVWGCHLLHDPNLIADRRVAVLPVGPQDRASTCLMTALLASGGLRWQAKPLFDLSDVAAGLVRMARVTRGQLRVINAGRVFEEVLAGAFPASGPWTTPPNLKVVQAPPGSHIAPEIATDLATVAEFGFNAFTPQPSPAPDQIGILAGVRMFFRHFGDALKKAPFWAIDRIITKGGEAATEAINKWTFGDKANVVIKFKPAPLKAQIDEELTSLQRARMPDTGPPSIPNPAPWKTLRDTAFGLVDGGDLPQGVRTPTHDTQRLLFVDPWAIGPAPNDETFGVSEAEIEILELDLPDSAKNVDPMDVITARAIDQALTDRINFDRLEEMLDPDEDQVQHAVDPPRESSDDSDDSDEDQANKLAIHRPSHPKFNPENYTVVSSFYQGPDVDLPAEYERHQPIYDDACRNHELVEGNFKDKGQCDQCGARFHHGVAYLHSPSGLLLHVGHICARKNHMPLPDEDPTLELAQRLYHRWQAWINQRRNSLLWQVGEHIARAIDDARQQLARGTEELEKSSGATATGDSYGQEQARLRMWSIRALIAWLGTIGGAIAWVLLTAIPILVPIIAAGAVVTSLVMRLGYLTRDLARLQTLSNAGDHLKRNARNRIQHSAKQLATLVNARDQFEDWQAVIRTVVHTPFGDLKTFEERMEVTASVSRPQSFVYATARPSSKQLRAAQLNARTMTVHRGWLTTAFLEMQKGWGDDYGGDLLWPSDQPLDPSSDNSAAGTVRSRMPGTNDPLYAPRQDFRARMVAGRLHKVVIDVHTKAIIKWLTDVTLDDEQNFSLDDLLPPVGVIGPGQALNGLPPSEFLQGLNADISEVPDFPAVVFGDSAAAILLNTNNIKRSLPDSPEESQLLSFHTAGQGRDLVFASCRMVFSESLLPNLLRGYKDHMTPGQPRSGSSDDEPGEGTPPESVT